MIELVKLIEVKALDLPRLWVKFSNGSEGIRDMSDILAEGGPMVEPLRDPAMFARVFLECGVPVWHNGLDLDAIALHDEMLKAGLLQTLRAAWRRARLNGIGALCWRRLFERPSAGSRRVSYQAQRHPGRSEA